MDAWVRYIFCAAPRDDESIAAAKQFARENGFTNETARIVQVDNTVCVLIREDNSWPAAKQK